MRSKLEDSVECQVLVNEVEEVTPVPRKVLDNSMGVKLDPEIEADESHATDPTRRCHDEHFVFRATAARKGKEAVRCKVRHQNQIYDTAEEEPGVVLDRRIFEFVVFGDLCLHLPLDEAVEGRMRLVVAFGIFEYLRLLGPAHEAVVVRLVMQQPANAKVIAPSPEQEDHSEDGNSQLLWEDVHQKELAAQGHQNGYIGSVLWLRWVEQLGDHVLGVRHGED